MVDRNISSSVVGEKELLFCLTEQSGVFREAVQLLESLEGAAQRRELGTPDSVSQLQNVLERVVTAQKKVEKAHAPFRGTENTLSADIKRSLKSHEELLRSLIGRIDVLQGMFEEIRTELVPQLDIEARRRSMHAAYRQSLKTL